MFRLADVAKKHLPHVDPFHINMGHCYVWAWIVAAHVPQATLWSDSKRALGSPYHAFPRIGSLFFDSEAPGGVAAVAELGCFKRCHRIPTPVMDLCVKHSPHSFFELWQLGDDCMSRKLSQTLHVNRTNTEFVATIKRFNKKHGIRL